MSAPSTDPSSPSPRKLKILMLHGYTQSGPLFHAKTRALEKALSKAFPPTPLSPLHPTYPGGISLYYPTAQLRLLPADIPGFIPSNPDADEPETPDAWGWFKRETGSGLYVGLEDGLQVIATAVEEAGGVDGIIGFSQGAAVAALVASLLEPDRPSVFASLHASDPSSLPYPPCFLPIHSLVQASGGLQFAVSYCGFWAPHESYRAFYEGGIKTPMLNVIGSLDSVVEEDRSTGLAERCEGGRTAYHPGGHFVPVGKEMAGVLVGWIKECCVPKEEEERVEDMDMPF